MSSRHRRQDCATGETPTSDVLTPRCSSTTDNVVPRTPPLATVPSRRHYSYRETVFHLKRIENPCATRPPSRARPRKRPLFQPRGPVARIRTNLSWRGTTLTSRTRPRAPFVTTAHHTAAEGQRELKNPAARLRRHATWTSRSGSAARRRRRRRLWGRRRRPRPDTRVGGRPGSRCCPCQSPAGSRCCCSRASPPRGGAPHSPARILPLSPATTIVAALNRPGRAMVRKLHARGPRLDSFRLDFDCLAPPSDCISEIPRVRCVVHSCGCRRDMTSCLGVSTSFEELTGHLFPLQVQLHVVFFLHSRPVTI